MEHFSFRMLIPCAVPQPHHTGAMKTVQGPCQVTFCETRTQINVVVKVARAPPALFCK